MNNKNIIIDMWNKTTFGKLKYRADACFYPHGTLSGHCYAGNIYDDSGAMIGDYSASDSTVISKYFLIDFSS